MYNHPRQLVNAVCGGSELLMWDVDKMITSIDFEVLKREGRGKSLYTEKN
jgi:hypothetical protein